MTPKIKNINLEDVLIFDIETASRYKNVQQENPEMFETFKYKRRDRETTQLPNDEEALEMYNNEAALSAVYGQIVCISLGTWVDGKFTIHSITGAESNIISKFIKIVKNKPRILVGYNLRFDIPYIRKRALHHDLPEYLSKQQGLDVDVKPWEFNEVAIDLMEILKGIGWANESLDEACLLLNVPSPKKGECSGANVSKFFHEGKIDAIKEYCEDDIAATGAVFLKLKNF